MRILLARPSLELGRLPSGGSCYFPGGLSWSWKACFYKYHNSQTSKQSVLFEYPSHEGRIAMGLATLLPIPQKARDRNEYGFGVVSGYPTGGLRGQTRQGKLVQEERGQGQVSQSTREEKVQKDMRPLSGRALLFMMVADIACAATLVCPQKQFQCVCLHDQTDHSSSGFAGTFRRYSHPFSSLGVNGLYHKLAVAKARAICECQLFQRMGLYYAPSFTKLAKAICVP